MDTIFAPITPVVNSAVIVVRISGPDATGISALFRKKSGENFKYFEHRKVYHLDFLYNNTPIDGVLVYFFKSPNSYTGEDVVEVSFHGNPKIVSMAFSEFNRLGFRYAEPGEFTKRAFLNGKIDLSQAEAVNELISSKSEFAVMRSFEQLKGNLKADLLGFKDTLLDILSIVEVFVDFPDEDIDEEQILFCKGKLSSILDNLLILLDNFNKIKYLKSGISVSIIGKPNVGKSSLLNVLLNENRAIVSDIPGTTRDYIEGMIMIGDLPVKFIDTAGIRAADSSIEAFGIEMSYERVKDADIVLLVFDVSSALTDEDYKLLELVKNKNVIVVGNKSDKDKILDYSCDVYVSTKTKEGVRALQDMIYQSALGVDFDKMNQTYLITERHYSTFKEVYDVLFALFNNFDIERLDLISIDLHYCLDKITEITGQKYTNELLDNIFSKFCIGK
ncbi:tRNA uridine-5-carboxymethylaminomethyl(34) synthesis GTPase MnmE [Deferribacteraceae bacterium V6Fe1]|nr:tRNA uridine-5-carboxymethylaminomethyl(34) synthesis GTPase MnmE [Deferribacteraceae bacterium V6Fe1]